MEKGFSIAVIRNQDHYVTSSAKVNIKLPPKRKLNFQGVVKDDNNEVLKGAAVMVFACYKGGIEKPMAYTNTDNEGAYFINIPEPLDYNQLDGFKVRAGK